MQGCVAGPRVALTCARRGVSRNRRRHGTRGGAGRGGAFASRRCQRTLKVRPYNWASMRRLRTASTRRLVTIVAVLVATVAAAGIAQAALTNSPKPDPKPLDRAIYDAVNAPPVQGITARVKFTNNLLPSGSMPGSQVSPILSGADGRVWLTNDGKVRIELQSDYGDAQFVADGERYMLYDAATKSAFTGRLPAQAPKAANQPKVAAERDPGRAQAPRRGVDLLGRHPDVDRRPARPTRSGSRPRTTAACSARPRWPGTPSAAPRCARRSTRRATTSRCSRSRRPRSPTARSRPRRCRVKPPAGAKVNEIDPPAGIDMQGKALHVEGDEAVQKQLDFQLAAPETLAGLPRRSVRLVRFGDTKGALTRYGSGFGADPGVPAEDRRRRGRAPPASSSPRSTSTARPAPSWPPRSARSSPSSATASATWSPARFRPSRRRTRRGS